jgi:hypothetical protein
MQSNFDKSKTNLEMVNNIFIDAQSASSNAASAISALQLKIAILKEDCETALISVGRNKHDLVKNQNFLTNCSFETKNT